MKNKSVIIGAIVMVILVALFVFVIPTMTNIQIWDMTFSFERAIIQVPGGRIIDGKVISWNDFDDGDQIQVKMDDGHTYLVHASNVCLISE